VSTFKIFIYEKKVCSDGKRRVYIRVTWKRKSAYIATEYYVTEKQINKKDHSLKDVYILNELNKRIVIYEDLKAKKLGYNIEMYSAKELADFFKRHGQPGTDSSIDFIEFARGHIKSLQNKGRSSTAATMSRTLNAMIDYVNGRDTMAITEITAKFLSGFENYLRSERVLKRKNQFGKVVKSTKPGLSDVSVIDYMTDVRTLFNAAVAEYNDEDKGEIRIMHYPFRKYKLKRRPEPQKRNLTPDQVRVLRDVSDEVLCYDRATFARDIFMLSFYLVGINLVDLYEATKLADGRLEYERKKTRGRRQDRAYISIKVEPEAMVIMERYLDPTGGRVFDFYRRYSTSHIFGSNVNIGLKVVAKACGIDEPLSTYYARHSWATIARNRCNVSKDDVDLALNHVDQGLKMADVYIEKDFSRIDTANRAVLDFLSR